MPELNKNYQALAKIYDEMMASVDYEGWANYVKALAALHGASFSKVLDLACGTGNSSIPFARQGYFTTGMDISAPMIKKAEEKIKKDNLGSLQFVVQDLLQLKLSSCYDLAVLFQDGLNYIIGAERLALVFKNVYRALEPQSLFIFDLTRPGLRQGYEKTSTEICEERAFTFFWQSSYSEASKIWSNRLVLFKRTKSGLYEKFCEEHQEQDYAPGKIKELLEESGFMLLGLYPSFSLEETDLNNSRQAKLTFVARRL